MRPAVRAAISIFAVTVAGVLGIALQPHRADAIRFTTPGANTVQGTAVCATAPNSGDVFTFGGTNWCGSQTVNLANVQSAFAGNAIGLDAQGSLLTARSNTTGFIDFGNHNASLDWGVTTASKFTFSGATNISGALGINGDAATMSAAPRMFIGMADFAPPLPAVGRLFVQNVFPKAATIVNCNVSWTGWTGCTTFPVYAVQNGGANVCSQTLSATNSQAVLTLTNTAVPAANTVNLAVTTAGVGCTQAQGVGNVQFSVAYVMQ